MLSMSSSSVPDGELPEIRTFVSSRILSRCSSRKRWSAIRKSLTIRMAQQPRGLPGCLPDDLRLRQRRLAGDLFQPREVDRLDQVSRESCLHGPPDGRLLAVAGDRDETSPGERG